MHHGRLSHSPRLQRVHEFLRGGEEHTTREIVEGTKVCAVNSAVAELRANGAVIECRQEVRPEAGRVFLYRMTKPAQAPRLHQVVRSADA